MEGRIDSCNWEGMMMMRMMVMMVMMMMMMMTMMMSTPIGNKVYVVTFLGHAGARARA